jgi:hypothetical protein
MITEQPLAGKSQKGGQRFGEMEVWALEAYGCSNTLQELLTIKSDDIDGRNDMYEALLVRKETEKPTPSISEAFLALIRELQALGLDFSIRKFEGGFDSTTNIEEVENEFVIKTPKKETETKKIVIATYSMAAEALDIKTLTTLIMATPKTDIEQSVGRILREKHSQPIVVDIIDGQELFQKQWIKRKAFYKKQNYKIIECSNKEGEYNKWKIVNEHKEMPDEPIGKCLISITKK